jgi:hypothetical protein
VPFFNSSIISLLFLGFLDLALFAVPYSSASDICSEEARSDALHPDKAFVVDWGVRVNRIDARDFGWQEVEVQQRPEIEYEQDVRVTYDPDAVSFTKFWQGCESFIGRQEQCESDESLSLTLTPDQLNATLESQESLITHSSDSVTSFSEPNEDERQVNDSPVLEEIFNAFMTGSEIEALGDFTQLGIRQAIRVTVDVNKDLKRFYFDELETPLYLQTAKGNIFVEVKTILKTLSVSRYYTEQAYTPQRSLLEENYRTPFCSENTCGFEFMISDVLDVNQIHQSYSSSTNNVGVCSDIALVVGSLSVHEHSGLKEIEKAIFHYEIQISIINTNSIENFNPLDYLDRDLTLPSKKDAGSLCYLLSLLSILMLFRRK